MSFRFLQRRQQCLRMLRSSDRHILIKSETRLQQRQFTRGESHVSAEHRRLSRQFGYGRRSNVDNWPSGRNPKTTHPNGSAWRDAASNRLSRTNADFRSPDVPARSRRREWTTVDVETVGKPDGPNDEPKRQRSKTVRCCKYWDDGWRWIDEWVAGIATGRRGSELTL